MPLHSGPVHFFLLCVKLLGLLLENREIVATHAFQQGDGCRWYGKTCESESNMENVARYQHIIILTVWLVLQHFQEYRQTDNTMIIFYTGGYKITSDAKVGKQALELGGCLPTKPPQSGSRCTILQQAYRQGLGNPEEGG